MIKGDIYDYIRKDIKNQKVFDIGANVGRMTKRFVEWGCDVISVEPLTFLTKHNQSNFKGATIVNACISDKIGEVVFYECENTISSSCLKDWKAHHPNKKWVKIVKDSITIDHLISIYGKPKYIKLDIEGYEDKALQGLSDSIDLISFEYTRGFIGSSIKCLDILENVGFSELISFVKKKGKKVPKGKIRPVFSDIKKFSNKNDAIAYLNDLPKEGRKFQGDFLVVR